MAWLEERRNRDGTTRRYAVWRDRRTGRRRYRAVAGSDLALAVAEVAAHEEGRPAPRRAVTGRVLLARFLSHLRRLERRAGTVLFYRKVLGRLVAAWGDVPVARWSRPMLEEYVASQDWAPRTTQMLVVACRRWRDWAEEVGLACPDFVGRFKGPTVRAVERRALSAQQLRAVLEASVGHAYELPVHLAAYAGLAYGDLQALAWREVDLRAGLIRRPRQKTGERIRVPIPAGLREALQRCRPVGALPAARVCAGLPRASSDSLRTLYRLYGDAGVALDDLPRGSRGWHLLRHSYATLLGASGADVATIGRLLGHRPGSPVTLRYLHPDDERMRRATEAVERALG